VFAVAVYLLVFDGLTTTWLCVRSHRLFRRRRERAARAAVVPHEATLAQRLDDDLARRQVLLQWSTHPACDASRGNAPEAVRRAVAGSGYEIRRAAELLAATPELVYDAATWETW
jgi:hypothetical protein